MRSTVGLPDLEDIFISHFHADHYLGLPGMLKTFQLRQRDVPLTVYGPPGLRELFSGLRRVFGRINYPLELVEVRPGEALERDGYRILVIPVHHGVAAIGYALVENDRPGRFDVETADALGVPNGPARGALQRGESVTLDDGRVLTPDAVLGPARAGRKIVIPGDTAPTEAVQVLAEGADVLVHEATFADEEQERAAETLHSTARQAAEVARAAGVRMLAITHLSPRYFGSELLREARDVFPNTCAPRDFDVIEVPFPERGEPSLVKNGARPERPETAAPAADSTAAPGV
jgi:ribonuclease Z